MPDLYRDRVNCTYERDQRVKQTTAAEEDRHLGASACSDRAPAARRGNQLAALPPHYSFLPTSAGACSVYRVAGQNRRLPNSITPTPRGPRPSHLTVGGCHATTNRAHLCRAWRTDQPEPAATRRMPATPTSPTHACVPSIPFIYQAGTRPFHVRQNGHLRRAKSNEHRSHC
jgi:hypothetical protein